MPTNFGLQAEDVLADAGLPGPGWGVQHDSAGKPIVEESGFYESTTSLENAQYPVTDQRHFVDADSVAYFVVPEQLPGMVKPIVLGCRGLIEDTQSDLITPAVVADTGPRNSIGEASVYAAKLMGVPSSPTTGGTSAKRFRYTFWPGQAAPGFALQAS